MAGASSSSRLAGEDDRPSWKRRRRGPRRFIRAVETSGRGMTFTCAVCTAFALARPAPLNPTRYLTRSYWSLHPIAPPDTRADTRGSLEFSNADPRRAG